jgi:hypothetical protein
MSLRGEQLAGHPVSSQAESIPVRAWITWQDGESEQVEGVVTEWTTRAVHVRWKSGHRISHEAWVWVGAVERL